MFSSPSDLAEKLLASKYVIDETMLSDSPPHCVRICPFWMTSTFGLLPNA